MENSVSIIAAVGADGAVASCWTTITIDDIALEAFITATERNHCPALWGHYCEIMEYALEQFLPSGGVGRQRESDPTPGGP